jgi:hypothetical protein
MSVGRVAAVLLSGSVFLTPGILPYALRAGFAVRAAPAAQWTSKKDELARQRESSALDPVPALHCIAIQRDAMARRSNA